MDLLQGGQTKYPPKKTKKKTPKKPLKSGFFWVLKKK